MKTGGPQAPGVRSGIAAFAAVAITALATLFLALPASAQTFPPLTGRVVDQADLLTPAQEVDLSSKSAALEAQTGRQFVVATVRSLEGRTIEDYGYRLGRAWGIGRKGKDDGILLLVAPREREVRIETGYGARVFLTDAVSSIIIRNSILPQFRKGDYGAGIVAGADQIIKAASLPPAEAAKAAAAAEQAQKARQRSGGGALPAVFWVMIIAFILLSMLRRSGGRRYRARRGGGISPWIVLWGLSELGHASRRGGGWGGGGGFGGGGFGGFSGGGGSFGGGGASGSW